MTEAQDRILQAASHIAGGMTAGAFAAGAFRNSDKGAAQSKEMIDHIAQISVRIAREIEAAVKRPA